MKGKAWSTAGFAIGVLASLSANVAHVYVLSRPPIGAVIASAFWPLALLISIEVIARVDWPVGRWWWSVRYGGLTTVAAIAAVISYKHMAGLLRFYGEDGLSAALGPIAVDGLMLVCSAALLALSLNDRSIRIPPVGSHKRKVLKPL